MRSALDNSDGTVRGNALRHLARHGDATSLPLFVRGITSDVRSVREASVEGIARFGTPETFAPLRAALETMPDPVASDVRQALWSLTFATIWGPESLAAWDRWWGTHAERTRLEWAEETLDASLNGRNGRTARRFAGRYLADVQPPPRALIERSLNDPDWAVRDAAIAAVQGYDRLRAAALLLRELDSRYLGACRNAVQRLNALTGEKETFDLPPEAPRQTVRQFASGSSKT